MPSRANCFPSCPRTRSWAAPARKSLHVQTRKFNFLAIQRGITLQNFVDARTLIQHIGDKFDGDSSATIDRCATHRLWVLNNNALSSLKFFEPLIEFFAHSLYLDQ